MKASILAFAAIAQLAAAHTTVYSIEVNGKTQGLGNVQGGYIDSPPNNDPVKDVTSKAMECNVANIKAARSIAVNGGDEITVRTFFTTNATQANKLQGSVAPQQRRCR